ncbi:MAG: metal ABC transporter permease, partial [Planctomycetota bacterium]
MSEEPRKPAVKVLAAIDVGTNSIRLVVAEAKADGSFRVLDDEKETTRLGTGLNQTGRMQEENIQASIEAIERMRKIAEGFRAEHLRIVGTSACRVAENSADFIDRLQDRTGLDLEVLSGDDEARLAFESVQAAFELEAINAAVVDIGGGSVEMVMSAGGVVQQVYTLDVGAVRLSERYGPCGPGQQDNYDRMYRAIRDAIRDRYADVLFVPHVMFGTGGTFTSLAALEATRVGVLKGDGSPVIRAISHSVMAGLPIAYVIGVALSIGALVAGVVSALVLYLIESRSRVKTDAAMALILT